MKILSPISSEASTTALAINSTGNIINMTPSGGSSAETVLLLLHNTSDLITSETSWEVVADAMLYGNTSRHSAVLSFTATMQGVGQARVSISDDTAAVTQNLTVIDSSTAVTETINIDCSTLTANTLWTINLEVQATSGDFIISRFSVRAAAVNSSIKDTLINSNPDSSFNGYKPSLLDIKSFPTNILFDSNCVASFICSIVVGDGVTMANICVRVSSAAGTSLSVEELIIPITTTGIYQGIVSIPQIIGNVIKFEIFGSVIEGSGFVYLNHYEVALEI